MRILVCAKNDLPATVAVNQLLPQLDGHQLTLWLSDVTRRQETLSPELGTLRFFERDLPNRWIFPLLEALDRDRGDRLLTYRELGARHDMPIDLVPSLRSDQSLAAFEQLAPDLVISIRFSHIFSAAFIDRPRFGIVNVHPGDLPAYAGLFAPFHQMNNGEARIGCTVHFVDEGIDTGPILFRAFLPIEPDRSLIWHVMNSYLVGIDRVAELVATLAGGRQKVGAPQDLGQRAYLRLPTAEQFAHFQSMNYKIADYNEYQEILAMFHVPERALSAMLDR